MIYYKNEYPVEGNIVLTKIIDINEYCVKGILIEYNNINDMLQLNQVSKRRVKSIRQIFKLNQIYPLEVLSVEIKSENVYIDLSNKTLTDGQKNETINDIRKYQIAFNLIKKFAIRKEFKTQEELYDLCERTIWELDKKKYLDISKNVM